MGGTIAVQSTPGKGTAFAVKLDAAEPSRLEDSLASSDVLPDGAAAERRTVLCIEDNPSNLELIEQIFAARPQIAVITALQGARGVELAHEHIPDLVLLDLDLPDISGSQVLARLQADPSTKDLPVVIVSADATERQRERMLSRGAHAYITKPLNGRFRTPRHHPRTRDAAGRS